MKKLFFFALVALFTCQLTSAQTFCRIKVADGAVRKGPGTNYAKLVTMGDPSIGDVYSIFWSDDKKSVKEAKEFNGGYLPEYNMPKGTIAHVHKTQGKWANVSFYDPMWGFQNGWIGNLLHEPVAPVKVTLTQVLSSNINDYPVKKITSGKYKGNLLVKWEVFDMSGFPRYYVCKFANGHLDILGEIIDEESDSENNVSFHLFKKTTATGIYYFKSRKGYDFCITFK